MFDDAGCVAEEVPVSLFASHATRPVGGAAPTGPGTRCSSCAMRTVCMPQGLTQVDIARLDSIICSTRMVRQGEALYRANDTFQSIYAVRAGSFKTIVMHRDGREQVTGFHLAGDVLGLDGVSSGHHGLDAIAIEDSNVCIIPFHLLESLCRENKVVQQHVHRMMSGEIVRESVLMMLLGTMSADQRLASFLLNLSARLKARGYSPAEFNLRMTREEIGSYLGMKLETVTRMFSKFRHPDLGGSLFGTSNQRVDHFRAGLGMTEGLLR
jgi:CRP/FNR family transcriptional regulator